MVLRGYFLSLIQSYLLGNGVYREGKQLPLFRKGESIIGVSFEFRLRAVLSGDIRASLVI